LNFETRSNLIDALFSDAACAGDRKFSSEETKASFGELSSALCAPCTSLAKGESLPLIDMRAGAQKPIAKYLFQVLAAAFGLASRRICRSTFLSERAIAKHHSP
jgi:hypothetical protein